MSLQGDDLIIRYRLLEGGSFIFKKVQTVTEQNVFNEIWMEAWNEKGYDHEIINGSVDQYLIQDESGNFIGTVEFIPFDPSGKRSTVQDVFDFSTCTEVMRSHEKVYEIDKVAIRPSDRRLTNVTRLFSGITLFAEEKQIDYYVALIVPSFYLLLRKFRIPLMKLGEEVIHKGSRFIPIIIFVKEIYQNRSLYSWMKIVVH
jgi:hypothetical protein